MLKQTEAETVSLYKLDRHDVMEIKQACRAYFKATGRRITFEYSLISGVNDSAQDAEELCSDVFIALWEQSDMPQPGKVRGYLGTIARHKAYSLLRKRGFELVLEEDVMTLSSVGPEEEMESREQTRLVQAAVSAMTEPDREIFIRYYYYCQRATAIAREMNMSPSAVRQRLKRGRGRLREELMKGGDLFEAAYF